MTSTKQRDIFLGGEGDAYFRRNAPAYASQHAGRMHACGHDLHTAVGVGVARLLHDRRDQLKGRVKLIFQPAEETLSGAQAMIRSGVLECPEVDAIVGFHNWPTIETGRISCTRGVAMASSDTFSIALNGVSGHAAFPHAAIDVISGASYFITQTARPPLSSIQP